jgi:CRISPR type III-B/RAMP module-associated protein Cmr5
LSERVIVTEALNCVESIASYASKDVAKGFRSRAREMPVYSFTHGLLYVLTLLAARSSKSLLEYGLSESQSCRELVERLLSRVSREGGVEEISYGLYGAVVLYILKRTGAIESKTFSDLVKELLAKPALEVKARPTLEWVKRFAEAYIEVER